MASRYHQRLSAQRNPAVVQLIFDGDCGLCNRSVAFLSKRDGGRISYIPSQSPEGKALARAFAAEHLVADTLVLIKNQKRFIRSSAVARCLWACHTGWKLAAILYWLTPKPLRDWAYKQVANNRHTL